MFNVGRSVEELPVLVRFDLVIPANAGDGVAPRKECVADHVAPTRFADAFVLASMHPDSAAIHERTEEHGPATSALTDSQNVELVLDEPLINSIDVKLGRDDLVIIQQENELRFGSVDRSVAPDPNAHIMLLEINHFAVFGGLRILAREPVFGQTIVNNNDLGFAELLSKRLDESMAGPRPMNGLDAKGNVLNGYSCFHVSPRVKEFASKFDGMAIVFETLRAAFDVHDRVQWCDVAVERDERVVVGLLKILCSAAHDFTHHVQRW
jgi:hypothetical protein